MTRSEADAGQSVDDVIRAVAEAGGDRPFLDFSGRRYTYSEVNRRVEQLARGFLEAGVEPGETVAALLDNGEMATFGWLAANRVGAIWAPINTALKGALLSRAVNLVGTAAGIVLTEVHYAERLARASEDISSVDRAYVVGDEPADCGSLKQLSVAELQIDGSAVPRHEALPTDTTCLINTGGTTGPSKACMISHGYLRHLGKQMNRVALREPDEVVWSCLPSFHLGQLASAVTGSAIVGGACAISPRFSVSGFWGDVGRSGARVVHIMGSMIPLIAQMADTPDVAACFGQVRAVMGVPFPPELEAIWRERFGVVVTGFHGYGLTEAYLLTELPGGRDAEPGSSGRRYEDFDVKIVDENDDEVGPEVVGEVVARPRATNRMFSGYWKDPEATLATLGNLWFHTGDFGRFDADDFFYFHDRKKDYLRRRGENISSQELEQIYLQHPEIVEVAVHAVYSELGEDDVKVSAVLKPGSTLTEVDLFHWAVDRMAYFALPRYIEFRQELPRSEVGRILKVELRSEGRTAATWDLEEAGITFEKR